MSFTDTIKGIGDSLGVNKFFEAANPHLDQTKKALETVRKTQSNLAVNEKAEGKKAFKKDIEELGITDPPTLKKLDDGYEATWASSMEGLKQDAVDKSPEKVNIDKFIADMENNLPVLKDIMKDAQPKAKWEVWVSGLGKSSYGKMIPSLLTLLGFSKDTQGTVLAMLGLTPAEPVKPPVTPAGAPAAVAGADKKDVKPTTPDADAAAKAADATKPAEGEAKKETAQITKEVNTFMQPYNVDPGKAIEDYPKLKDYGLDEAKVKEAAVKAAENNSRVAKLYKAIKEKVGKDKKGKEIPMNNGVLDIRFEAYADADITKITDKIGAYKKSGKEANKGIRAFLGKITKPENIEEAATSALV